ncbi:hypothetical protein P8452_53151 [Trifolium repens]|nr:hypothetical protein P8452_53151 [Trifolium repens]
MSSASFRLHHSDGRLLRQNQPFSDEINPSLRRNQPFLSIVHHQMNPKTFFSPPFSKTFLCLLEGEDAHILSETKEEVVRAYVDFVKAHFSFEGNFDCMNDMHLHCWNTYQPWLLVFGLMIITCSSKQQLSFGSFFQLNVAHQLRRLYKLV